MAITHFGTRRIDPVVITFVLAVCFAATCTLAIVVTAGVLGG